MIFKTFIKRLFPRSFDNEIYNLTPKDLGNNLFIKVLNIIISTLDLNRHSECQPIG